MYSKQEAEIKQEQKSPIWLYRTPPNIGYFLLLISPHVSAYFCPMV